MKDESYQREAVPQGHLWLRACVSDGDSQFCMFDCVLMISGHHVCLCAGCHKENNHCAALYVPFQKCSSPLSCMAFWSRELE